MGILQIAEELGACTDAIAWLEDNQHLTTEQIYCACPQGDWLLWFFDRIGVDQKPLALAACDCADLVKHLLPAAAPKNTTDIARAYLAGTVSFDTIRKAAKAIDRIEYVAYDAVDAAFYAARAACGTGDTAEAVARCAACAAHAAGGTNVYTKTQQQCADIVRKYVSFDTAMQALNTN